MKHTFNIIGLLCLLLGFFLVSEGTAQEKNSPAATAAISRPVIVIGTDGFSAEILRKNPNAFPNLRALMKSGSSTLEMRTVLPSSSACNWMSILSASSPELHGFTDWDTRAPALPPRITNGQGRYPDIYSTMREQYPEAVTGYIHEWIGMKFLIDEKTATKSVQLKGDEFMKQSAEFLAKASPDLAFIVLESPDGAGHSHGWQSKEYLEAAKVVDKKIGELLKAVKNSPRGKDAIVIVISDHGGKEKKHGGKSMEEMEPVFIIAGRGIKKNYTLKTPAMIYDVGSTIAYILKVKQPQVWIGRPLIEVFGK